MRLLILFVAIGLLSASLMIGVIYAYPSFFGGAASRENHFNHLQSVADSKAKRINSFMEERQKDIAFLSETKAIVDSFDEDLVANMEHVTALVKNVAQRSERESEEYIKNHPNLTVNDLVNDPEFRKIAMKRVGKIGYTVFHGPDTIINYLHWDPKEQGDDHSDVFRENPEGQQAKLLLAAKNSTEDVSGFYTKKTSEGELREKFMYMSMIPSRTADNIRVAIQATVFLDEFGKTLFLAKDLDEQLRRFKEDNDYVDLLLIDLKGDVIWTAEKENDLGSNLERGIYRETELARAYTQTKESQKIVISNPGFYEASEKKAIFITAPVFGTESGEKVLKGVVALQMDNKKIEEIMGSEAGLGNSEEVYAVSGDGVHITPLLYDDLKEEWEFRHAVRSIRVDRCLQGLKDGESDAELTIDDFSIYNGYYNKPVYGVYQYVPTPKWCVIAEVDAEEVKGGAMSFSDKKVVLYVVLISVFMSALITLGFNKFFFIEKR